MIPTRLSEICAWMGAGCPRGAENIMIDDICRDSRAARPGSLFIPLPGTRYDGHDFIPMAAQNGASATLCARDMDCRIPAVHVGDALAAAQAAAAGYRDKFDIKVLGITGSVGKTTTARMAACVLGTKYRLLVTEEDSNGQIGLPFRIFSLSKEHQAAVLEMGMSLPGEMTRLTKIARPDAAVINSIGTAHIEAFGSREKILKAKLEITLGLKKDGYLILCGDEPLLRNVGPSPDYKIFRYGIDDQDAALRGKVLSQDAGGSDFDIMYGGRTVRSHVPAAGTHNVRNALAAVAAGVAFGVSLDEAATALEGFTPARGRQNIKKVRGVTVMDDCYNASPEAVCASLDVLKTIPSGKKFAALGGMLELGDYSKEGYMRVGRHAAGVCDWLLLYGDDDGWYADGAAEAGMEPGRILRFESKAELAKALKNLARPGDAVLFKGSHATGMNEALKLFSED